MRNGTAIGKNTDSQEARRNKDSEFTSHLGEETNIYRTTIGEIWHGTKGMEAEGFQDIVQFYLRTPQQNRNDGEPFIWKPKKKSRHAFGFSFTICSLQRL